MNNNEQIEKHKNKINTCLEEYEIMQLKLNEWEINFLESVQKQLSENNDLSWKQIKCLNRIYERIE